MICTCPTASDATNSFHTSDCDLVTGEYSHIFLNESDYVRHCYEREYWERVHLLACLTNCAENADEIADKAVSAWRERWAKEGA